MEKSRYRDTWIFGFYLFIDIILFLFSFYLPFVKNLSFDYLREYALIYSLWGTLTILLFIICNLYRTERELTIPKELSLVWKAIILSSVATAAVIYFSKTVILPKPTFIINCLLLLGTFSLWRMVKRFVVRYLVAHGYNNFNTLIIGGGSFAKGLIDEIRQTPYLGLKIVGLLDDFKEKGTEIEGYRVLGRLCDFETLVQQNFVDVVLVTIPGEKEKIAQLINSSGYLNVSIRVIPERFGLSVGLLKSSHIGYIPTIEYITKNIHGTELLGKRMIDMAISGLGLILLLPLFVILAILIKIDSRGPIFYISKRFGKKGRVFNFYKFRSMVSNADDMLSMLKNKNDADGPIFKIKNDPRVTNIGKFLRKYSLDELPQLWNVLKGDMSTVGPRPLPLDQVENSDLKQLKRLGIKPGITGLWQIQGRSDIAFRKLIKWDNWYIKHWSLSLDFRILLRTIPAVLHGKGAY